MQGAVCGSAGCSDRCLYSRGRQISGCSRPACCTREFSTGQGYTEETLFQGKQMDFKEYHLLQCFLMN